MRQPGSRPSRFRTKQMAVLHIHRSTRRSLAILTRTRKWRTCSQRHNPQDIGDLARHGGKRFHMVPRCVSQSGQTVFCERRLHIWTELALYSYVFLCMLLLVYFEGCEEHGKDMQTYDMYKICNLYTIFEYYHEK